jgi:Sulfatase
MQTQHRANAGHVLIAMLCMALFAPAWIHAQTPGQPDDPRLAGFKGKIAKSFKDSKQDWPERPKAVAGAPNVLVILQGDVGFGQIGAYGGLSKTPNIDQLAAGGLAFTNLHTPALCSPARPSLRVGWASNPGSEAHCKTQRPA